MLAPLTSGVLQCISSAGQLASQRFPARSFVDIASSAYDSAGRERWVCLIAWAEAFNLR